METQSRSEYDVTSSQRVDASLHLVAKHGDEKVLKKILRHSCSEAIERKDDAGRSPLLHSAEHGNLECMLALLKAGACINSIDNLGRTALHLAIDNDSYSCAKLLLSKGAEWSLKDKEGETALHYAVSVKSPKYLLAILDKVVPGEIDIKDAAKQTALHWSAAYGHPDHFRLLIKKGANVCIPDKDGKSPLHWAAHSSNPDCLECLKIILEKFPNTINWQDYEGRSALHIAVLSGSIHAVNFLTSRKDCDMQLLDNQSSSAMHYAAREGSTDKLALLLGKGAKYEIGDANGATPMHYAACSNNVDAMKIFLSRTYVEDVPDECGRNAFMWAAAKGANNVIRVMSTHVDFSYADKAGLTALHIAAHEGLETTVKLLLTLGAPVEAADKNGSTPLLIACDVGNIAVIKVLLDHGASLLATDFNKKNSLHRATKACVAYVVELLFHLKPELDTKDCFGKVPLHYASENGSVNCVSVLVESGSNPNVTDDQGRAPLHYAALNNHYDIVRILLRHGAFINSMAIYIRHRVTPLDCAVRCGNDVLIEYLQSAGGLTFSEIRTIAAKKIQSWFRKILSEKQKSLNNAVWCEYHTIYHAANGKMEDIAKCRGITLKDFYKSDPCIYSQSSSKSCVLNLLRRNVVEKCDYFDEIGASACRSGYDIPTEDADFQKSVNVCVSDKNLDEGQVSSLQKSWQRFILTRERDLMQQKINAAFPTMWHRKAAEKKWLKKLEKFLGSL